MLCLTAGICHNELLTKMILNEFFLFKFTKFDGQERNTIAKILINNEIILHSKDIFNTNLIKIIPSLS